MTISGADVNARPFARPGEALEVVPGLIVTQHSGEGKANQYFLRGFNLDHGTDLAIRVDGMPVNMPTHGHGQGYADINFMIPELIQSVNVRKGPYFADVGDFGSAGAVAIDYINRLPKNIAGDDQRHLSAITAGWRRDRRRSARARCSRLSRASNTTVRGTCPTMCASSTACCATARAPRPMASRCRRWPIPTAGIRPTRWRSARSTRASSAASARSIRPTAASPAASRCRATGRNRASTGRARSTPTSINSSLRLYNNFTYFLDDPVNGDQFSQMDRRTVYGLNASHAFDVRVAGIETQTRVGVADPRRRYPGRPVQDAAARDALDRARRQRPGRQCRPVGRYDGALDRLAAHHGRHPRGLFCGERAERHAGRIPATHRRR